MIRILDFDRLKPQDFLNRDIQAEEDVSAAVDAILAEVRKNGDAALREYTKRFNGVALKDLRVTAEEFDAARKAVDPYFMETLKQAAENIRRFHERQKHNDFLLADRPGVVMGQRWTAIEKVGVCVPRCPEAFPSTILMNVIPAKIAGVQEIVLVTPPREDGTISPEALAAAELAGADAVFKSGGAQAVAALAYGTETVPRVDKIVGPGGVFVATAKRKVFGQVDIDMIAGPSEILVLADGKTNPKWTAADLLSQAEHDVMASAVLVTDSRAFAEAVQAELEAQLADLPRQDVARKSIEDNGKIIVADSLEKAVETVNRIAPEHLELCVDDPFALLPRIKNAGSIFLGRSTPEALGDYFAGPNHTLPTSGTARFSSPLGVDDFMKRSSFLCYDQAALQASAERIADFARREGLEGHARSALSRKSDGPECWEQVKTLVEGWKRERREPDEAFLQKLHTLTGQSWTAEAFRKVCGRYAYTEWAVYFLFHKSDPPRRKTNLIFYRPKPGVTLPPAELWERHRRAGKWRTDGEDLLDHLPLKRIMRAFRSLPDWEETEQDGPDSTSARFCALEQPDGWSDAHFWTFWYGQKPGMERDHLLCVSCTNLTETQIQFLIDLLAGLGVSLQYREEE